MIKRITTILLMLGLASCGTSTYEPDPRIYDMQSQLAEYQQQQLELGRKLDTLALTQEEANALVVAELARTQWLISQTSESISSSNASDASVRDTPVQSKAQWLEDEGKVIVGGVENITFTAGDVDLTYTARIDTGATSSSLDARDISRFERDGDRWVRFKLYVDDEHYADIERAVVRWVRIFQSTDEEGERRPVVELAYKFGNIEDTADFTLTDRSHLEHPALIGRNIITDRMIVDVSDSFIISKK